MTDIVPIPPAKQCPHSGMTILRCKRSDLCDCFDFPEQRPAAEQMPLLDGEGDAA
jgi:hypothetical protein